MGSQDEAAYRRSVRNTAVLLAVVVLIVAAGIAFQGAFSPAGAPATATSVLGDNGLALGFATNSTFHSSARVLLAARLNGSSSILNVSASDAWAFSGAGLWKGQCIAGWPLGIGVMEGYYDQYNYSSGTLIPLKQAGCASGGGPSSFLLQPGGSEAIVSVNSTLHRWDLVLTLTLSGSSYAGPPPSAGPLTVVAADEWGDVALLHLSAPQASA